MKEHIRDPLRYEFHLRFFHPARGDGGATQADSASLHRRKRIKGNRIFVHGDSSAVEGFFGVATGDSAGMNFNQEDMIISAAGNDPESLPRNRGCKSLCVDGHLLLI